MKRLLHIAYWLLMSLSCPAFANTDNLVNILRHINTLDVQFVQTEEIENEQPVVSYGSFKLKVPGKFAWLNENREQQDVIADGETIWIYDKDLVQVRRYKQSDILANTPALLLSEPKQLTNNFTVDQQRKDNKCTWYHLTPKRNESHYDYIEVCISESKIQTLVIFNRLNNALVRIDLYYTEGSLNGEIDDKVFDFVVPEGVDILY